MTTLSADLTRLLDDVAVGALQPGTLYRRLVAARDEAVLLEAKASDRAKAVRELIVRAERRTDELAAELITAIVTARCADLPQIRSH